jgi:hypothetical protein
MLKHAHRISPSQNLVRDHQIVRRFATVCGLALRGHLRTISTLSQIIPSRVCEQRRLRTRRVSDRRHGYRDLHLVDAVANRMIIAVACDCWFGVLAAATD